ncbi:Aste57867_19169 [Aphanomyces stellatus]|uniref:Aste57867_19169 protein n=1 Tax=Aphanomyces stellatus TaxID=120398 RepID=A0A485LC81_9STRA|nr:hypothetical protein As57867_019105 [Aphanomyces stellatus]VFT95891.1 Aste57867_19169 [Aphanomyces stellatus]
MRSLHVDERLPIVHTRSVRRFHPHTLVAALVFSCLLSAALLHVASSLASVDSDNIAAPLLAIDSSMILAATASASASSFHGDLRRRCDERYFVQALHHIEASPLTFNQRYFVCDEFFTSPADGPIFFYVGNEGDVELYLNHTGLMWENAASFGARLVFAEHRYFGKSMPPRGAHQSLTEYAAPCASQLAMVDYAVLLAHLRPSPATRVVVFGGSYGGMLAAWMRVKYPHLVHGAIAASAPMLSFLGMNPPMDLESFSRVVTYDATAAAGAALRCRDNIKRAWPVLFNMGATHDGRKTLERIFRPCNALEKGDDVQALAEWIKSAYDSMAMGNYPYPSSYMTSGARVLPAFPMRHACSHLDDALEDNEKLLQALSTSVNVFYNDSTAPLSCHVIVDEPATGDEEEAPPDFWEYLSCADMYTPLDTDGGDADMFWRHMHNETEDDAACRKNWGVPLRPLWPSIIYGGIETFRTTSNIVFSNGEYDPWAPTGILKSLSETVVAVNIPAGAHHLDLMFSNPLDPQGLRDARDIEASVFLGDLDDFIAPSQACVNPLFLASTKEKTPATVNMDSDIYSGIHQVAIEPDLIRSTGHDTAMVSLNDCLACSGCVTSAESILISQQSAQEFLTAVATLRHEKRIVVTLSPQARASVAAHFNLSIAAAHRKLVSYFRGLGVHVVLDSSVGADLALLEAREEFLARYRNRQTLPWVRPPSSRPVSSTQTDYYEAAATAEPPAHVALPMLSSSCPGWVCYAEKSNPNAIPYISTTKSPQQITGTLVKRLLSTAGGRDVYHCTVMPCYDKKLEASRNNFLDAATDTRDVDCVLAASELLEMLAGVDLAALPDATLSDDERLWSGLTADSSGVMSGAASATGEIGSGGYLEHIFRYAAKTLFNVDCPETLPYVAGRNADFREVTLVVDGRDVLKFALAYGFRNIQTVLMKIKRNKCPYDFVEIMACPGGCLNGGGQIKPESAALNKPLVEKVYRAFRDQALRRPEDNPAVAHLYQTHWQGAPFSDAARAALHTRYHAVPKLELANPFGIKW